MVDPKPISWSDIEATCRSGEWASLSTLPVKVSDGFETAYERSLKGQHRQVQDDVSRESESFAVGPRLVIFFDKARDTAAAILVFDRMSGTWQDAGRVWKSAV